MLLNMKIQYEFIYNKFGLKTFIKWKNQLNTDFILFFGVFNVPGFFSHGVVLGCISLGLKFSNFMCKSKLDLTYFFICSQIFVKQIFDKQKSISCSLYLLCLKNILFRKPMNIVGKFSDFS
jgi:hypothetical protein